jgi:fermentation-respiration switch protein FrsA (DUF1100 family)
MFRKLVFCALLALGCKQSASPPVHYGAYLPGGCVPATYTVQYTDTAFQGASLAVSETLFSLASRQKLCSATMDPQVAFAATSNDAGTSITAVSCSLGTATVNDAGVNNSAVYLPALNVEQTTESVSQGGVFNGRDLATPDSNLNVVLRCTATGGNFGTGSATKLSAGKLWITVGTITLPAGS